MAASTAVQTTTAPTDPVGYGACCTCTTPRLISLTCCACPRLLSPACTLRISSLCCAHPRPFLTRARPHPRPLAVRLATQNVLVQCPTVATEIVRAALVDALMYNASTKAGGANGSVQFVASQSSCEASAGACLSRHSEPYLDTMSRQTHDSPPSLVVPLPVSALGVTTPLPCAVSQVGVAAAKDVAQKLAAAVAAGQVSGTLSFADVLQTMAIETIAFQGECKGRVADDRMASSVTETLTTLTM